MIRKKGQIIRLDTPNTTLVIKADTAQYIYYGKKLVSAGGFDAEVFSHRDYKIFSDWHGYDYAENSLLFDNADAGFTASFTFSKSRILDEKPEIEGLPTSYGEGKTLEVKYIDLPTKISLYLYYTVYDDSDVIAVSAKLVNGSKKEIKLRRFMSLQLDLQGVDYSFVTFEGEWARERQKISRKIESGTFVNESRKGMSSHANNPFVMAEKEGAVYGFNLLYSGNHKEVMNCTGGYRTRILTGMNDFMFEWPLAPGESFSTPEAVMCFATDADKMSSQMHEFVVEHIVRGKWKRKERPILVNNWEGTYFNFNEEKLLEIAAAAKKTGVELFVLDDGWFGKRDNDRCSLGDWTDNIEKTGGGLAQLADKIRALGLDFGIWVEPEMISEDSDLFRAHPNYAIRIPGRDPYRHRHQLCLNMADERVQNYVIRAISDVISRSKAAYVKWDYNRSVTDCYAKGIASGEFYHRYILGVYRVISKIMKKFPNVLFEGCAGGGGRFDLGMFCYFPQFWTSDDTDARMRIKIQSGTSYGYPQRVMGAHVSAVPNHQTLNSNPIETRFNVALGGILGYELDMSQMSEEDTAAVTSQISFYKQYRQLLQFGDFYRLGDAFGGKESGFMFVSKDKSLALASVFVTERFVNTYDDRDYSIKFKGLNEAFVYEVSQRKQNNYDTDSCFTAGGDILMNGGVKLSGIFQDTQAQKNSGCVFSRVYIFNKVKK